MPDRSRPSPPRAAARPAELLRPTLLEGLLVDPPRWARSGYRALMIALPVLVTIYGVWYDALAAGAGPDLGQTLVFTAAGATLWVGRRYPFVTVGAALACWSITESCVFVIAAAYLLGRWQPRAWWLLLLLLAAVHPLGLVPDPCAYRAGHTALPPETTPIFAVALPALLGRVVLTSVRLAAVREERLQADAEAARERARTVIAGDRLRLSEEMHDLLGQRVSRMVLHATAISATSTDEQTRALAARIADTGASTVDDLRFIMGALRQTPPENDLPLTDTPSVARSIIEARRDGLRVDAHGLDALDDLPEQIRDLVDAAVAEALHNAAKYAGGSDVAVLAQRRPGSVVLQVENGPGTPLSPGLLSPGGHGLARLRHRAQAAGGQLWAGTTDEGGFAVTLEVPQ